MPRVNYNERSWAIDLISEINIIVSQRNILIKKAGGENTILSNTGSLFPDVLLFGDMDKGRILQGWELKMPDTSLEDTEFIYNAKKKAKLLSLNSFLLWNVSKAVLYKIEEDDSLTTVMNWNNLSRITTREEVLQNTEDIRNMLVEIINDLNNYFANGTITSVSVVTVLSSDAISDLIQRNISSYVSALTVTTQTDINFSDEITLWWRYAKNDYPEDRDKFVVLARNNLLSIVNKFLFAHILKSYQAEAGVVDTIDSTVDVNTALRIFTSISERCDFWNIFQKQKGEELITTNVWADILSLNNLLKEFDFTNIDKTLLHDLIGVTVYKNKRKFAGQFTTPQELAKFITKLTVRNKSLPVIDPCCGTGTIAREIYKEKKAQIGFEQALDTLWASDKFSLPLQMAMFNLADPEAMGSVLKVFKHDATMLTVGENIELHEPFTGNQVDVRLPRFGYIVSNLPFVQQEDLELLNPSVSEINTFIKELAGREYALDGRSDLYQYLPFYFWKLLDTNGVLSIIVSNSWLGTKSGQKFYLSLRAFFTIESVITSGKGRWFSNAKVVTNIISLKKRDAPETLSTDRTKFVVTNRQITDYDDNSFDEMVAIISNRNNNQIEDDISLTVYTNERIDEITALGLNLNSLFSDTEWILDLKNKLRMISSLYDVARGERRGWDKLFYPEDQNNIELEYLKPVLKTPRSISTLVAQPDAVAFCCNKSKAELQELGHTGALAWIERFEGQNNEDGTPLPSVLARSGIPWYTMLPTTMGDIVTSINFGDRLYFARFNEPTFVNQRLVRFTPKTSTVDGELCHALMNSVISMFYIEAMGTGRGDGVLDLSKDKIEDGFRIIDPDLISTEDRQEILRLFRILESRPILHIEQELQQPDRIAFDEAVLSAIDMLAYKTRIETALLTLYKIRTSVKVV